MAEKIENYEEVAFYPIDDELREQIYETQTECAVVWSTKGGWPVGVMHRFVWKDGKFWVTCSGQRKRVPALRKRPQSCVIVSAEGTKHGPDRTTTAKTLATVHDDAETKAWFYPALAAKMMPGSTERQEWFVKMLDSGRRVVIELEPVKWITYDGHKLAAAVAGGNNQG